MARKEDVFTVANFFEINTLCHWRKCPCVTKTQRYGYIWYIGSCAEPSHRSTVGCEKSAIVLKGKWHKNIRKCKMAKNHFSRSDFGSWGGFLGVLGAILYWKVVLEFWFGHPKCHFRYPQKAKMTHFCFCFRSSSIGRPSPKNGGTKNGTWGARIKILRPLFNTNPPLKPPFRHFGNHFGPWKSDFWPFYFFGHFPIEIPIEAKK